MAYKKTTWINKRTKLNAHNLNHIEDGIFDAAAHADELQASSDNTIYELANTKLSVANIDATVATQTVALATETNRAIEQEGALIDAIADEQTARAQADSEINEKIEGLDADIDEKLNALEAKLVHVEGDEEIHGSKAFKYAENDTYDNIRIEASKTVFGKELEINDKAVFNGATLLASEIKDQASDFSVVNKKYVDSKDSTLLTTAEAYADSLAASTRGALQKSLEDETASRKSVDSALTSALNTETRERKEDITALQDSLKAEETARLAADESLEASIEGVKTTAEALQTGKVDKEDNKSLLADTEIERLSGISSGATKVEKSETNGNIKIDGIETTVYTEVAGTVHDASYAHITIAENSVSDGTTTFTKYDDNELKKDIDDAKTVAAADTKAEASRATAAEESLSGRIATIEDNVSGADSVTLCGITITKAQLQSLLDLLDTMEAK